MTQIIGWASSLILLATIVWQISHQWRRGTSKGVSRWLFIGQAAASAGFTIFSYLVGNLVFLVTSTLMLLSALVGLGILVYHRHRRM